MIRRGDIYYADLSPVVGSEQGGIRPVLVIQNNVGNRHSPTVICAAITSKMNKAKLPTHIEISTRDYKIVKNSVILLEQIRTIDKQRLKEYVCHIDGGMNDEEGGSGDQDQPGASYIAGCLLTMDVFFTEGKKSDKIPSLTVGGRKNGYTLDFIRAVAIFCFVTICAIFLLIPVLTVSFL